MKEEFDGRCDKLRSLMQKASVDAYLVTDPTNIYYLSGFTGDEGLLLITEKGRYLITDARFETQIKTNQPWLEFKITRNYLTEVLALCEQQKIVALAFEETITYQMYDQLDELALCDIVPLSGLIESLREIKSPAEIKKLKKSCQLAKEGYQYILEHIQVGQTELEVALELDYFMRKNGATKASFETIVASGARSALPHGVASTKKLQPGELVTLDYGYFLDHYTSDVTRTIALGEVTSKLAEIYQVVATAKQETIAAIRPGIETTQLDEIGRNYIKKAGYGEYFEHGIGHGIGLSVHENPYIGKILPTVLRPGQVITIEPGIYLPGLGGIRLEDDILVTENGHENLTDFGQEYRQI